jgi:hypothetical protein
MQMQYEEKSNLEERIIAHFDGSLDHASSKALLDEVMASPEKRALFRAHETLQRVIVAARVPMEAPLEARREIADRIPGLIAFIPGLLGTAETMPILQQSTNPFISFFARMSLQTAVSIGSAVAVLTTAGIIVKNNLDNKAAQTPKIAAVQSASPTISQAPTNSSSQNYAMAPRAQKVTSSGISKHTASNVRTTNAGSNTVATQASISEPASQSNVNSSLNIAPAENDNSPRVSSNFDSPKPASAIADNIPVMQSHILMPMPEEVNEGITVRPYLSSSNRFIQLNGIGGSATSKFVPSYLGGLEFELGDRWAFRAQGGQSDFSQVSFFNTGKSIFSIPKYGVTTVAQQADWATLGMSYSFVLSGSIPLIVSGDAGAAFLQKTALMGMLGVGTEIPLSSNITLRPQLTYDVVSASTQPISSSVPSGNAILQNSISTTSMVSQAFGFQINMMFRF